MESESKRRKLDHSGQGIHHKSLINFESSSTSRLSAASTFVLKTDELLKETKLDYATALQGLDSQLHKIKGIIDSIKPHDAVPIHDASVGFEKKHRVTIPYPEPRPTKDSNYKVSFLPPAQCNVVGSFVGKTMVKSQERLGIDMVVQMPKALFQDKDYLDMRYFYRRAYYIAYIAASIKPELGNDMQINYELLHENPLLPILVLRLQSAEATKTTRSTKHDAHIRLIPCAPDDLFPWSKLTPTSKNIRADSTQEEKSKNQALTLTPFYNSTLNAEKTFIQYLRVTANAKNECAAFEEACILGRIWLQQRGFGSSISRGGFGHFEWAAMIALLLKMGGRDGQAALSKSLSPTELFKAAIQFLSTTDFTKRAFAFNSAKAPPAEVIKEAAPVMFDPVRQCNILFKMTPWSANMLQMYAKSTGELLADEAADKFDATFITKADIPLQIFDALLEIKNPNLAKYSTAADRRSEVVAFGLDVHKILKKAFGNRAVLVHIRFPSRKQWKLTGTCPAAAATITLGVIFNLAQMGRQMELGPSAEDQKEAAKFRQFWGEKAELRRFKDGSILECIEWSNRLPLEICHEITQHALGRHLKLSSDDVSLRYRGLTNAIEFSHLDKMAFDAARTSFQKFEHDIRSLEEMPLQIRQLAPISPVSRYASIEAPHVGFHKDSVEPMDVNLYFEASSKWPENLTAIQEAKIEFLLDIDRRLTAVHSNIRTCLGRENRDIGISNLAYLDIMYDSGAAFRLRVHCDLEETLLRRQAQDKTLDHAPRADAEQAARSFHRLFNILPLHTQTVATYCTRLPALSPTIRLVKHWFAAHKLAGHVGEELVELLVLRVFLEPWPWPTAPSSAATGFLRTLAFLSRWDWRDEALILDTVGVDEGGFTAGDRGGIQREMESRRRRDPGMNHTVLVVATPYDRAGLLSCILDGEVGGPSKLVAGRMTHLAKAACRMVREAQAQAQAQAQTGTFDAAQLFAPALRDFDVLFHLSKKALRSVVRESAAPPADDYGGTGTAATRHTSSRYSNLDGRAHLSSPPLPLRAGPAEVLVGELRRAYADTLVFFPGGAAGDDTVAALWDGRSGEARCRFRAGLSWNFRAAEGREKGDTVEVNRGAVLLEIARVGGGLIRTIEVIGEE